LADANAGIINEDVSNRIDYSPFRNHKDYLKPILTRLFFEGVVPKKGLSADVFLDYEGKEPWNTNTWHPYTRSNYIDYVWEHLRFSFRADRGMPRGYDPAQEEFKDIKPWAHEWKDKKGEKCSKELCTFVLLILIVITQQRRHLLQRMQKSFKR
jgi:hypothetical protein